MMFFTPNFIKPNKTGYTADDKPETRLELFFLVLRDHISSLIITNLSYFATFLLVLLWSSAGLYYIFIQIIQGFDIMSVLSLFRTFVLILFPLIFITGPFMAGLTLFMRNLARDDKRHGFYYFKKGLTSCWKQSLIVSFICAALPICIWGAFSFYLPVITTNKIMIIPLSFTVILCLLFYSYVPTLYTMIVTYEGSVLTHIKNTVMLCTLHLPLIIGTELLLLIPILLLLLAFAVGGIVLMAVFFIVFIYYFFIGLSFSFFVRASVSNKLCEEYLNALLGEDTHIGMID